MIVLWPLDICVSEASFAVQARAVKDYCNIYDPQTLAFKQGDIIKVSVTLTSPPYSNIYDPQTLAFKQGDIIKVSLTLTLQQYEVSMTLATQQYKYGLHRKVTNMTSRCCPFKEQDVNKVCLTLTSILMPYCLQLIINKGCLTLTLILCLKLIERNRDLRIQAKSKGPCFVEHQLE